MGAGSARFRRRRGARFPRCRSRLFRLRPLPRRCGRERRIRAIRRAAQLRRGRLVRPSGRGGPGGRVAPLRPPARHARLRRDRRCGPVRGPRLRGGGLPGAGPGDTQYEDGPYEDEQYGAAPHGEAEYGPAGYGQAHQPGAAHYAGVLYDQQPYAGEGDSGEHYAEDGPYAPYDPDGSHPGQQAGYQPGGYAGHEAAGYGQPRLPAGRVPASLIPAIRTTASRTTAIRGTTTPATVISPTTTRRTPAPPTAGPPSPAPPTRTRASRTRATATSVTAPVATRASRAGPRLRATVRRPTRPRTPAVETPGYADGEYRKYPDAGASTGGLRPDGGYAADDYDGAGEYEEDSGHEPDPYGSGDGPGYVAAEYASGQFPAGIGAIGELSAGMPDLAATGMLAATGILDSTGISDHVELYNYHPGAAAATQGFLGAPAPVGTLDATGIDPPGYLDDPARGDHGIVLDGAEAGDATGVLEGGSGFFDDAAPAEITAFDLPAESQSRGGKTGGTGALLRPRPGSRPVGRRRGRSGDRRLWFALGGVVVVFVGAIVAIVMVAFPSGPGGPAHTLVTPNQLNAFTRRPALEQQMNVAQLRQDVVTTSSGQARHVVEAVYEAGNSTSGSTPQIILFIGGNLLNASPQVSVTSFTQRFKGAKITSAGGLGEAACVNATASQPGSVAMCAWFDNDSFGEVVSPTMNASALANAMRQIRPHVELVAKQ